MVYQQEKKYISHPESGTGPNEFDKDLNFLKEVISTEPISPIAITPIAVTIRVLEGKKYNTSDAAQARDQIVRKLKSFDETKVDGHLHTRKDETQTEMPLAGNTLYTEGNLLQSSVPIMMLEIVDKKG